MDGWMDGLLRGGIRCRLVGTARAERAIHRWRVRREPSGGDDVDDPGARAEGGEHLASGGEDSHRSLLSLRVGQVLCDLVGSPTAFPKRFRTNADTAVNT
jgi:hypothetical protein